MIQRDSCRAVSFTKCLKLTYDTSRNNLDNAHAEVIIVRHSGIAGLYSEPINWQNGVEISSLRDA